MTRSPASVAWVPGVYAFEVTRRSHRVNFPAIQPITTLMSRTMRLRLVFLFVALAIGGAVWLTATAQRSTATARAHRLADAQQFEDTTLYQELEAGPSEEGAAPPPQEVFNNEG